MSEIPQLNALQESADRNRQLYNYDRPNPGLLETFPAPKSSPMLSGSKRHRVRIDVTEFTSLCPLTGQPDFARIVIEYSPRDKCVESKSLKLYLLTFRQHGAFHEQVITQMYDDLIAILNPLSLYIQGQFTPRGGIPFWPEREFVADDFETYSNGKSV